MYISGQSIHRWARINVRQAYDSDISREQFVAISQELESTAKKGYDAGKKTSGIKVHIAVDVLGLPYATLATTANVSDRDGAIEMFSSPDFHKVPALKHH
jgi:hypothetical protein